MSSQTPRLTDWLLGLCPDPCQIHSERSCNTMLRIRNMGGSKFFGSTYLMLPLSLIYTGIKAQRHKQDWQARKPQDLRQFFESSDDIDIYAPQSRSQQNPKLASVAKGLGGVFCQFGFFFCFVFFWQHILECGAGLWWHLTAAAARQAFIRSARLQMMPADSHLRAERERERLRWHWIWGSLQHVTRTTTIIKSYLFSGHKQLLTMATTCWNKGQTVLSSLPNQCQLCFVCIQGNRDRERERESAI